VYIVPFGVFVYKENGRHEGSVSALHFALQWGEMLRENLKYYTF
jgi:hypothetical protein